MYAFRASLRRLMLTFVAGAMAFLAVVSPAHAATPAVPAAATACTWRGISVTHLPVGIDVIAWQYSCDGGVHCQAVSTGFIGRVWLSVIRNGATATTTAGGLYRRGASLNTNTVRPAAGGTTWQCGWTYQANPS